MKVVAIANQKGGVGKTTTTVNLAAALAQLGKRVLLIDLDPQANATSGLGIETEEGCSLYSALVDDTNIQDLVLETGRDDFWIIPAEMDLAGVEIELARRGDHLTRLRDLLAEIRDPRYYDYCLIDTPPSLGVLMTSALAAADEVLTPLQCEFYSLEGLAKITHVIEQIRESGVNDEILHEGIVMTMYDGRTNLSRQVVEEVREHLSERLYDSIIPRSIRLGEAPSFGHHIFEHDAGGAAAHAYLAVAKEFLARHA